MLGTVLRVAVCPSDPIAQQPKLFPDFQVGLTSYLGVNGQSTWKRDGLLFLNSGVRLVEVSDGTSNTLAVGERPPSSDGRLGWWYAGWGINKAGTANLHLGVRERSSLKRLPGCPPGPYHYGPSAAADKNCDVMHFWSYHPNGANFLFADGSVHFLSYSADSILPALATRAGGEVVAILD